MVPMTLAANLALMMPAGTPPNAIVFGTELVTTPQRCKTGVALIVTSALLLMAMGYFIIVPLIAMR